MTSPTPPENETMRFKVTVHAEQIYEVNQVDYDFLAESLLGPEDIRSMLAIDLKNFEEDPLLVGEQNFKVTVVLSQR